MKQGADGGGNNKGYTSNDTDHPSCTHTKELQECYTTKIWTGIMMSPGTGDGSLPHHGMSTPNTPYITIVRGDINMASSFQHNDQPSVTQPHIFEIWFHTNNTSHIAIQNNWNGDPQKAARVVGAETCDM